MNNKTKMLTEGAIIAALYTVLTLFISAFGLASGAIQVRISEALCVLPAFTPAAVPGLFIGCLLSNSLTGAALPDIVFGSLATLLGAIGTHKLKNAGFLCTLPPVISNMVIIPLVLKFAYGLPEGLIFLAITVGAGEFISVCIIGSFLKKALEKNKAQIFN